MQPTRNGLILFGGFLLSLYIFFMNTGLMVGLAENSSIPSGYWSSFLWMNTFAMTIAAYFMVKYSYWKGFIYQGVWFIFMGISAKYYEHVLFMNRGYLQQDNSESSSLFIITGIVIASISLYLKYQNQSPGSK